MPQGVGILPSYGPSSAPARPETPDTRVPGERQVLLAGFALALVREQDVDGLLAETCRLCRRALPASSFAVLQHPPHGGPDVVRAAVDFPRADGAGPLAPAWNGGGPAVASSRIPGENRPFGVLRIGSRDGRPFAAADQAFLVLVAELLGAAIVRLGHDAAPRLPHVRRAAPAEKRREITGALQEQVRNDLQVLQGFAHLRAPRTPDSGRASNFGAISRRLVSLAAFYDHLRDARSERQVDLREYLRNLCARIEAAENLAGRGIALGTELHPTPMGLEAVVSLGVAVNELVANAAERAFDGQGGRILVRLAPAADGRGRATLRVADDGNGVGRLPEDGGLSYVHRLVARAGARIEREAGVGTNWRIDLR